MGFSLSPSPSILFDGIKGRKERKKKRLMLLLIRPWKSVASRPRFFLLLLLAFCLGEGNRILHTFISKSRVSPSRLQTVPETPTKSPPFSSPKRKHHSPSPIQGIRDIKPTQTPSRISLPLTRATAGKKMFSPPPLPSLNHFPSEIQQGSCFP